MVIAIDSLTACKVPKLNGTYALRENVSVNRPWLKKRYQDPTDITSLVECTRRISFLLLSHTGRNVV